MGQQDRTVDVDEATMTIAEFMKQFDLEPFLLLLDRNEDFKYPLGDLVTYVDEAYMVIGRRAISAFAAPRFGDFELLIESLTRNMAGFVSEDEVEPVEGDEADKD